MPASPIPIQNLYYLLLYAWDKFPEGKTIEVGSDDGPQLPNLLAKVLLSCVRTLLRRGLERSYSPITDETSGPRGRFLLAESIKRNTLVSGRLVCAFDELTVDTHVNRTIKSTLIAFINSAEIATDIRAELIATVRRLGSVRDIRFTRQLFRPLQIGRANGRYGLALQICRLAVDMLLPQENGTGSHFVDILRDKARMSTIFEHFVRNFYRSEQTVFNVRAEIIRWDSDCDADMQKFLPDMRTDITLRSNQRTIVIDTKYYPQTLVARFEGSHPKIQSPHLYQLQAYLRNMQKRSGPDGYAEGVLLYPCIDGEKVRIEARLEGHRTRVWTVDLSKPWLHVHNELLAVLDEPNQLSVTGDRLEA